MNQENHQYNDFEYGTQPPRITQLHHQTVFLIKTMKVRSRSVTQTQIQIQTPTVTTATTITTITTTSSSS